MMKEIKIKKNITNNKNNENKNNINNDLNNNNDESISIVCYLSRKCNK